jgi:4-methyl-5(b-hydroxyethyl)-thiazole monophosphate biosynthesis
MIPISLGFVKNFNFRCGKTLFNTKVNLSSKIVNVLVPVANGSEEIETVTIIATLVRGGAKVTVAAISDESKSLSLKCSRGVLITADRGIEDCQNDEWDMIVCPGGIPGTENLKNSNVLHELLLKQQKESKYIAAICASPAVVLAHHKLLDNAIATCYPANKFIKELDENKCLYSQEKVVVFENFITSQGPGTSLLFSLKLVELLFGKEKSDAVAKEMVLQ